jgi:hypothetical protein
MIAHQGGHPVNYRERPWFLVDRLRLRWLHTRVGRAPRTLGLRNVFLLPLGVRLAIGGALPQPAGFTPCVLAGGGILRTNCLLLRSFCLRDVRVSSKAHVGPIPQRYDDPGCVALPRLPSFGDAPLARARRLSVCVRAPATADTRPGATGDVSSHRAAAARRRGASRVDEHVEVRGAPTYRHLVRNDEPSERSCTDHLRTVACDAATPWRAALRHIAGADSHVAGTGCLVTDGKSAEACGRARSSLVARGGDARHRSTHETATRSCLRAAAARLRRAS